jgi:hypothetical protein
MGPAAETEYTGTEYQSTPVWVWEVSEQQLLSCFGRLRQKGYLGPLGRMGLSKHFTWLRLFLNGSKIFQACF